MDPEAFPYGLSWEWYLRLENVTLALGVTATVAALLRFRWIHGLAAVALAAGAIFLAPWVLNPPLRIDYLWPAYAAVFAPAIGALAAAWLTLRGAATDAEPGELQRRPARLDRTRPRHLAEQARRGGPVAGEEHAVAARDGGAVPPRGTGQVERARAPVHHQPAAPGRPRGAVGERDVEQAVHPRLGGVRALARADRHLGLDQLLPLRGQRRVRRR